MPACATSLQLGWLILVRCTSQVQETFARLLYAYQLVVSWFSASLWNCATMEGKLLKGQASSHTFSILRFSDWKK